MLLDGKTVTSKHRMERTILYKTEISAPHTVLRVLASFCSGFLAALDQFSWLQVLMVLPKETNPLWAETCKKSVSRPNRPISLGGVNVTPLR